MYIYLSEKELRPPDELKCPQYFGLDLLRGGGGGGSGKGGGERERGGGGEGGQSHSRILIHDVRELPISLLNQ